jgi:hypothetical protein
MANLYPPPAVFDLPLSLGRDLSVDFQRQDSLGNPVDYDVGTVVNLIIDSTPQTIAPATVTGNHATVLVGSDTVDAINRGLLWRCRVTLPDGTHVIPCNGIVARYDGRS